MQKKGIPNLLESYHMGIKKFYDVLEWCVDLGVDEVTVYALSTENIENRGSMEIKTLLKLFSDQAVKVLEEGRIHENKVCVRVCGDRDLLVSAGGSGLGRRLVDNLRRLEEATKDYRGLRLNLAIAYGGRREIVDAVKRLVSEGFEVTEDNIRRFLWIPDCPELIIRTAEQRLSNFLLWQSAYSEIYFVDKLWQEFEREDLEAVLRDYSLSVRRFGK